MRCIVANSLDTLPSSFLSLLSLEHCNSYFTSSAWYQAIIDEVLRPAESVRLYGVEDHRGNALCLFIAATAAPSRYAPTVFQRRSLRSLSYITEFRPITAHEMVDIKEVVNCLVDAWSEEHPLWTDMAFYGLDKESGFYSELRSAFRERGFLTREIFNFNTYYDDFHGQSSKEFISSLGSNIRRRMSRRARQLEESMRSAHAIVADANFTDQSIVDYEQIFRHSWKGVEPHSNFIRRIIRDGAKNGSLRLSLVYVDGIPAATQLAFVWRGRASLYRTAFDERFRHLGVGGVAIMHLIRHLIDGDKVRMIDFGVGDQPYKQEWLLKKRSHWAIVAANPSTLAGPALVYRHVIEQHARAILGRLPAGWRIRGKVNRDESGD